MKVFIMILTLLALPLFANSQSISGIVIGQDGKAMPGVSIRLISATDSSLVKGTISNAQGKYILKDIKSNEYFAKAKSISYKEFISEKISIKNNEDIKLNITLIPESIKFDNIVVTASRSSEKASEAATAISIVDYKQIENQNAVSTVEHLRSTPGMDIAQSGIGQNTVVARGFNNVFSGSLMMLTDYRNSGVPSLRANISYLTTITDADIERIEVARGPGSALYGPNAANGVVNIITKSPFASQGTIVELSAGENSLFQSTVRHAGTISENLAYKLTANYTNGLDWAYTDSTEQANRTSAIQSGAKADTLRIGKREPNFEKYGLDARVDYMLANEAQLTVQGGYAMASKTIELTDLSASQGLDWAYSYALARLDYDKLMVQTFINQSNSGSTYLIRNGNPIIDRSKQIVSRIQHSSNLDDNQEFTYGADMFLTRPDTEKSIMGENENQDDINEFGAYLQSKTSLLDKHLDLILALRYDNHNKLSDGVISPRAALVYKFTPNHAIRATYNTGYTAPYAFDLFADIQYTDNAFSFPDAFKTAIYVKGVNKDGLHFERDADGNPLFRSPFSPDKNLSMPMNSIANYWTASTQMVVAGIQADTSISVDQRNLIANLLQQIPNPKGSDIGAIYKLLNSSTLSFDSVNSIKDISQLKPTITHTFELGYTGIINDQLRASIDVYSSKINNFISTSANLTPNIFMKGEDVAKYLQPYAKTALIANGYDSTTANIMSAIVSAQVASGYAKIPLGTAAVKGMSDPTAIIFAPRNYGEVELWGTDIALEYRPNNNWSIAASYTHVSQNLFKNVDNISDIPLNSPKDKASFSLGYTSDENTYNIAARYRWNGGFPMQSGIMSGYVNPYSLIDLNLMYQIPMIKGLRAVLSVSNLLDYRHNEFAGAAYIGRMSTLKAAYTF
jgi:outer membrane receptor for ferrienterochelin and colicins